MKNADQPTTEKLSEKLKNMVKMFPAAGSLLGNKNKLEASSSNKTVRTSHDYTAFDMNGLNHKPIEECDKVFEDCVNFLKVAKETIQFTQNANPIVSTLGLNMRSKINKWRAKRKGNHLFLMFEALQERVEATEAQLNALNTESNRNISSLVLQSLHLKARLKSCIQYNLGVTEDLKPIIQEAQALLEHFQVQERGMHSMLVFFDEVAELAKHQPYVPWAMRKTSDPLCYSPGGSAKQLPDVEVSRKALVKRCARIKKIRQLVEHNLDVVSRRYDVHHSNFTHCTRVLNSLNKTLLKISAQNLAAKTAAAATAKTTMNNPIRAKSTPASSTSSYSDTLLSHYAATAHVSEETVRQQARDSTQHQSETEGGTANDSHPASKSDEDPPPAVEYHELHAPHPLHQVVQTAAEVAAHEEELRLKHLADEQFIAEHLSSGSDMQYEEIPPYDHQHCSDCTCVYGMANECLMHLAASQHQASECGSRLRRLVGEFKEALREDADKLEALDWGGHNHVHLA